MQNLRYPVKRILINSLTVDDLGLFTDGDSLNHLIFKEAGVEMVDDGSGTYASVIKDCVFYGSTTSVVIVLNPECPCEECDYQYGFSIKEKKQHPGVRDYDYIPRMNSYEGVIDSIECSGGYITDAQKLIMENTLLTQMKDSEMEHSFTEGRRFYKVTDDDNSDDSVVVITDENGIATTVTADANAANQLVDKINDDATVSDYVFAFATAEDEVFITSVDAGYLFTVAATTDTTIVERGIWVTAKRDSYGYATTQFDIEISSSFATVKGLTFYKLDASGAFGVNQGTLFTYALNGSVTTTTIAGAAIANVVTNLSAVTGVYARRDGAAGDNIYVYQQNTLSDMIYKPLNTGTITITDDFNKFGRFPALTGADVFREFALIKNQGCLSPLVYLDQVNPEDEYCKYVFNVNQKNLPAQHGASHRDNYLQEVHLYVKKDKLKTDLWDATNYMYDNSDAAYTADTTIDELILAWCGTNPA